MYCSNTIPLPNDFFLLRQKNKTWMNRVQNNFLSNQSFNV